jgi:hypothetical protein
MTPITPEGLIKLGFKEIDPAYYVLVLNAEKNWKLEAVQMPKRWIAYVTVNKNPKGETVYTMEEIEGIIKRANC